MKPTDRIPINSSVALSPWERLLVFLGCYDHRFYVTDQAYLDIGGGSVPIINNVSTLYAADSFAGSLGSVGRWCEVAPSAEIQGRGEHDHDLPVNVGLGPLRQFNPGAGDIGMKPMRPVSIGSGVVISAGARILSGVSVGDGAVIGANATVTRDVPQSAIMVGTPAKISRFRPTVAPWWDLEVAYLVANLDRIQAAAVEAPQEARRPDRPRFAWRRRGTHFDLLGFTDGGPLRPMSEAPERVRVYLAQLFAADLTEAYWVPDCWAD